YVWTVTPSLPSGLTLTSAGVISGTPSAFTTPPGFAQTFGFKGTISTSTAVTVNAALTINPAPLAITPVTLPNAQLTLQYSQQLQATGGVTPYNWTVPANTLPA